MPADVSLSNGAGPSAGTVLTTKPGMTFIEVGLGWITIYPIRFTDHMSYIIIPLCGRDLARCGGT